MKSVIQHKKQCFFCGTEYNLHDHHIFFGTSNRKNSEEYGLKVFLCREHHTGNVGVHYNKDMDLALKELAQRTFEKTHSREEFMSIFGRNWL